MSKHPLIQRQRGARVASLYCVIASVLGYPQGGWSCEAVGREKVGKLGPFRTAAAQSRGHLAARLEPPASEIWQIGRSEKGQGVGKQALSRTGAAWSQIRLAVESANGIST